MEDHQFVIIEYQDGTKSAELSITQANELEQNCPEVHLVDDQGIPHCADRGIVEQGMSLGEVAASNPLLQESSPANSLLGNPGGQGQGLWIMAACVVGLALFAGKAYLEKRQQPNPSNPQTEG